ncbi:MAG TPA: hypothetical protein VL500_07725 [Candidatus Eisenbacteria bacterium]|nr:hypothetical protein [Candidatus Eisenbacteria bacterium]
MRPPETVSADATLTVAPPYHDPEYAVRLTLPRPGDWAERYNIDGGEGAPDPILRLTRRSDGATIEVLFLPRSGGTPAEFAARLRADLGGSPTATTVSASGDTASFENASGGRRARHRVVHLTGMTLSHAYLRVSAPPAGFASASSVFDAVAASLTVVSTGPLSPKAALAQCLATRGVRLYGTWWCGPCHMQEQLFGDGASRLDHVQCSAPGETDQLPVCSAANIRSYPTWVFPDGSRLEGVQDLNDLADKAGCPRVPAAPASSSLSGPDGP